jgi:hypothetical protein
MFNSKTRLGGENRDEYRKHDPGVASPVSHLSHETHPEFLVSGWHSQ